MRAGHCVRQERFRLLICAPERRSRQSATGLHPTEMALDGLGQRLFVANANEDTVSVIDLPQRRVAETITVRVDPHQPFGSAPNALALSADGRRLYVCNGGNNAVAVIRPAGPGAEPARVEGFIPTAWYPADVIESAGKLFIANLKGWGSLATPPGQKGFHVRDVLGTITVVDLPDADTLVSYTRRVRRGCRSASSAPGSGKGERAGGAGSSSCPRGRAINI